MSDSALNWMAPASEYVSRRQKLAAAAQAEGLAGVIVGPGADLRYLTGRTQGSHERFTALIIPSDSDPFMITPSLEKPGWEGSLAAQQLEFKTWFDGQQAVSLLPASMRGATVAVDDYLRAGHVLALRDVLGCQVTSGAMLIGLQRMRKSEAEIQALEAIARANDSVQEQWQQWVVPGRTEDHIRADISQALLDAGHAEVDFCIIGSGPNGASPHHESSLRQVQAGEPVVVDIGGPAASGYFSDCTRTYCVGTPSDPLMQEVYDVVLAAQQAAVQGITAGTTCEQVDAMAREVITQAGFGQYFITRTGHGIGMECHEHPYQVTGNTLPLEPGMTFSVEPGIYLPGKFGVRIEDIVVVQADGSGRSLNHCPKEFVG